MHYPKGIVGVFFFSIRESANSALKEAVSLRFVLTQHLVSPPGISDEELLRSEAEPRINPPRGGGGVDLLLQY